MIEAIVVKPEEKAELRRSFEFGAYIMITHYLAERYGLKELDRFANFWAKMAAKGRRKIVSKSRKEFLDFEAKVERVWVDREVKRQDEKGYVGVVDVCPLRKAINTNRGELPKDYFCDHICATIYPKGYRLLGLKGRVRKSERGCRVDIDLRKNSAA
jgi:hypothetical protein